jgi:hypothetical protein
LDRDHIIFHLPQPGATAVTEISREFKTNSSVTAVSEVGLVEDGAEIAITLGQSDDRTFVNGELCLRWAVPPGTQPLLVEAPAPTAGPKLERDQYPGIELLTPAQIAKIQRSLPATPSSNKRHDMLVPKRVPFVPRSAQAASPAAVLGDRVGPLDVQKQAREQRIQSQVCKLLRGNPERPEICNQP